MRGEQLLSIVKNGELVKFNSRPCGRGDGPKIDGKYFVDKFQFTPLREGRRGRNARPTSLTYFNSRPCGRGDHLHAVLSISPADISIHAPAGGATHCGRPALFYGLISIHAPAGGATLKSGQRIAARFYFNSRPCGRGDFTTAIKRCCLAIFQFTPLREGRRCFGCYAGFK